MKYLFTYVIILITTCALNAQIILDVGDLPKAGDVQLRARVDSVEELMLDPGEAGENIDWEFAWFNFYGGSYITAVDSVMWIDNLNTVESDSFLLANIAQRSNCYLYHNWQTHAISLECYNKYYSIDQSGLHLIGSTYPNIHKMQNTRNLFPLLNYGDTLVEESREVVNLSADSIYVTTIIDTTIVDGWGTVHTPLDDLEALRFYTKETVWDSLYVYNIGEEVNFMPDNYYYRWYSKELGFPVFQISKGILEYQSQYQVARFKMELKRVGIEDNILNREKVKVFPNPTSNMVTFNYKTTGRWSISLFSIDSKLKVSVNDIVSPEVEVPVEHLPDGIYLYCINSENQVSVYGKLFIVR